MLGPIPNSLGAGAYNGSFMPHGLVTFSSRGGTIVVVFQEVCLDAFIHASIAMVATLNPDLPIVAVLHPDQAVDAQLHDQLATDSRINDILVLEAIIEEC